MSSRISQRTRSRRNQCSSAKACATTQRCTPRPEPMLFAAPDDHRGDPRRPDLPAVLVMVITAVGVDPPRALAGPAAAAADRRGRADQGHELGDVVAVAAGQRDRQRDAVRAGDQMVLGAWPGTAGWTRPSFGPPFKA